jgi:filamentous hemagglutinin family protein
MALLLASPFAHAADLPTGGNVIGGSASIGQSGNTMTIDQSTQRAAINWNTFNIGSGYTVQFNQPGSQSITLNRVVGGVPSNIQGALLANGQVWIQNANGVLFGSGATINVNSLLVTTKNINVDQFMSGSNSFDLTSTGINAGIINDGSITAHGYVMLVGDQVRNTGDINAKQVTLAAGDSATVALDNGQGISVTLTNSTANALVENSGRIVAGNDGSVLLTAQGKDTLLDTVINLSGVVKAGTIVADVGNTGDITVTGKLDASNENGQGGTVVLSGNRVGLFDDAVINVSGDTGGGLAIIGGDKLNKISGSGAAELISEVTLADYTQIDSGVQIDAGSAHGDGGFVETSANTLSIDGTITAAAPNGQAGLWLIDPTDIKIWGAATDANTDTSTAGTFKPVAAAAANVNNGTIASALDTMDVLITTLGSTGTQAGNITLASTVEIATISTHNLTLEAAGNISIQGNITLGGGDLNLAADAAHNGNGAVSQSSTSTINLNGGNLTASGDTTNLTTSTSAVSFSGDVVNVGNGTLTGSANKGAGVSLGKDWGVGDGGHLTIIGNSNANFGVVFYGNLTVSGSGIATVTGTSTSGTALRVNNVVSATDGGTIQLSGTSLGLSPTVSTNNASFVADGDNSVITLSGKNTNTTAGDAISIFNSTLNASGGGEIVLNGSAAAGVGVKVDGSVGVIQSVGNGTDGISSLVNISGSSGNDSGISMVVTLNASQGGEIVLNGSGYGKLGEGVKLSSGSKVLADGVGINGNVSAIHVTGHSINSYGIAAAAAPTPVNIVATHGAEIVLDGSSDDYIGVHAVGSLVADGSDSTINVIGSGGANGTGVTVTNASVAHGAEIFIRGNAVGAITMGVVISRNFSSDGSDSVINVNGTGGKYGVYADSTSAFNASGGGAIALNGDGGLVGVYARGQLVADGSDSALDIIGISSRYGVAVEAATSAAHGSAISFDGNGGDVVGVAFFGYVAVDDATLKVNGVSDSGSGVALISDILINNGSKATVTGNSTSGFGVEFDEGSITTNGGSATGITGNSETNVGMFFNGSAATKNDSSLTVFGNASAYADGLIFGSGSEVNISMDSATAIYGFDTSGSKNLDTPASATTDASSVFITCRNELVDCGISVLPQITPPADNGDDGGGSGAGVAAGAAAVGGLIAFLASDSGETWALQTPQALTSDTGILPLWCNAMLDYVEISADQKQAFVRLHTQDGLIERQLPLKDSGGGVKHFGVTDPKTGAYTELSFNPETREYFLQESGIRDGQAYTVKSHGWLGKKSDATEKTRGNYALDKNSCAVDKGMAK